MESIEFPWPAKKGPWWITLHAEVIDGRLEPTGLEIRPLDPAKPRRLSTQDLRGITLADLFAKKRGQFTRSWPMPEVKPWRGKGRQPVTPGRLKEVAEVYVWARDQAPPMPPTATVAKKMHVSYSTAARLVGQAREAGFLKPTTRGRAGGVEITVLLEESMRLTDSIKVELNPKRWEEIK